MRASVIKEIYEDISIKLLRTTHTLRKRKMYFVRDIVRLKLFYCFVSLNYTKGFTKDFFYDIQGLSAHNKSFALKEELTNPEL